MRKAVAPVIGLLILFTSIEDVGLIYWLNYGNTQVGIVILTVALLAEHAISLIAGLIAGMYLTIGRRSS